MQEKECKIVRVISQKSLASDVYSLWLDVGEMAKHAKAGQFVSVYSKEGSRMSVSYTHLNFSVFSGLFLSGSDGSSGGRQEKRRRAQPGL